MTEDWDSYFVQISDQRASIFLNPAPPSAESVEALPFLLYVQIVLHSPGHDGLSTAGEFDALSSLEDEMKSLVAQEQGQFVGRYTHDGARTFLVYVPIETSDTSGLAAMLKSRGYAPDIWSEPDPEWKVYHEWLYPSPEELQTIQDRRTLEALAREGDDHMIPRDVDHWIYFKSAADRAGFLSDLDEGFEIRSQWDDAPSGERPYALQIVRSQAVDLDSLAPIVRSLFRNAQRHDGDYDGWETTVQQTSGGAA